MTSVVRFAVTNGIFGVGQLATRLKAMESAAVIGPWHVGTWVGWFASQSGYNSIVMATAKPQSMPVRLEARRKK